MPGLAALFVVPLVAVAAASPVKVQKTDARKLTVQVARASCNEAPWCRLYHVPPARFCVRQYPRTRREIVFCRFEMARRDAGSCWGTVGVTRRRSGHSRQLEYGVATPLCDLT